MALKAVKIPCKKYVAKYLYSKIGARYGGPIILNQNSNIYLHLKTLLSSKYKRNENRVVNNSFSEVVLVLINSNGQRQGYRLTNAKIRNFNNFIRNMIFEEFRNKVYDNSETGENESKEYLAEQLFRRYNIVEDELSVDTILRDERRNKVYF